MGMAMIGAAANAQDTAELPGLDILLRCDGMASHTAAETTFATASNSDGLIVLGFLRPLPAGREQPLRSARFLTFSRWRGRRPPAPLRIFSTADFRSVRCACAQYDFSVYRRRDRFGEALSHAKRIDRFSPRDFLLQSGAFDPFMSHRVAWLAPGEGRRSRAVSPEKGSLLSKGNREVRKPKTVKPKVIAAAPAMAAQTLSARKK
jgi:hypothetical protein